MSAMSYGCLLEGERFAAVVFRVRLFAAMEVSDPHALGEARGNRGCLHKGFRRAAIQTGCGTQPDRTQASSFASKTVFGGHPIELAYALKSRRLLPCFSASCCNSRIRSPMSANVDPWPVRLTCGPGTIWKWTVA